MKNISKYTFTNTVIDRIINKMIQLLILQLTYSLILI